MSKHIRRVHPRVSYEQRIRLLGEDGKPVLVGRTMNISPSGIYVRAPNGCEIGSEVTCDLPLPGGTRQLRGRVTRTQALPDESTGIGIQFVDLNTGDSRSLHRALEGHAPHPVLVKVMFEGMKSPIKCQGTVTAEGIRLSTSLPFLRLGSDVQAVYSGGDGKIDARGVLAGVRLEPAGTDGVPRLGVDVELDGQAPPALDPDAPDPARDDVSAGGAFTAWEAPARASTLAEPAVITDPALETSGETTEIVPPRQWWKSLSAPFRVMPAWAFAIVALLTFAFVYLAVGRLGSLAATDRAPSRDPAPRAPALPVIVPASGAAVPATPVIAAVAPAAASAPVAPEGASRAEPTAAEAPARPRVRPAKTRAPGTPFDYDQSSGRYELRAGARIDMKGEPLMGLGGLSGPPESKGQSNLRGINVVVESGALYLDVALPHAESDGRFAVHVTPSWPTTTAIGGKSTTGFTVSFGTPAPADAHLDWFLVR